MRKIIILLSSVLILLLFLTSNSIYCTDDTSAPLKVVLLTIPGVTLDDLLTSDPNSAISRIMNNGAIGLMNSRTAGRILEPLEIRTENPKYTPEAGYLTIGAGARAAAGSDSWKAYDTAAPLEGSTAGSVYQRQTLIDPGDSKVVYTGIARIQRDNAVFNYKITIGLLGSALKSAGIRRSVFGNSDDANPHREITMLAMDQNGLVDDGDVERTPSKDSAGYLLHNESDALLEKIRYSIDTDKPGFIAVEYGDLARLERAMPDMTDAAYMSRKIEILKQADSFINRLERFIGRNGILIILSPYPSYSFFEKTNNSLCPILVTGRGINKGLLSSGSTRISGIITNLDIAPSILNWFGLPSPPEAVGRPMTVKPSSSPVAALSTMNTNASRQAMNIPVLHQAAGALIGIAVLILLMWFTIKDQTKRNRFICAAALIPSAMLPVLLLTAVIPWSGILSTWIFVAVFTIVLTVNMIFLKKPMLSFMNMGILFTALVAVDMLTGGRLCGQSIIGYSVVEGSRYYGMGNEIMGALTGAMLAVIGLMSVFGKWSLKATRIALIIGMVVGTTLIGAPSLGINTGGAISIVTAFGAALAAASQRRFDLKSLLKIAAGVGIVLAILIAFDVMRGQSSESHLGKAFGAFTSGGSDQIGLLIKRKLAMNFVLVRTSIWSKLLIVYLISIGVFIKYGNVMQVIRNQHIGYRIAAAGILAGMVAAFIFNDSGVVAAGTCVIYLWSLMTISSCEPNDLFTKSE